MAWNRSECSLNKDCSTLYTHQKFMCMEVHIYSVKAKSQLGNIWVKYIMITQKDQSQNKISLGSKESQLENLLILLKTQLRVSDPGESTAGATYQSVRIHTVTASFP